MILPLWALLHVGNFYFGVLQLAVRGYFQKRRGDDYNLQKKRDKENGKIIDFHERWKNQQSSKGDGEVTVF